MAKNQAKSASERVDELAREHGVRDTIDIGRTGALADWTGPVTFTDLDLTKYSVIITKVVGGNRLTFFARRDGTVAYFMAEGDAVAEVTAAQIEPVIRLSQVAVDAKSREKLLAYLGKAGMLEGETCAIVVARGRAPVDGDDSKLTWHCGEPQDFGAGKEKDDGSVDYRERQSFVHVKAGDHILSVTPPTKGQAGFDFKGTPIPARDGEWKRPLAGTSVRSEGPSQCELYAVTEGVLELFNGRIHVKPMLTVVRVDFSTGNIRYSGDVTVVGGVEPGFEVVADGRVQIDGDVSQAKVTGEQVVIGGRCAGSEVTSRTWAELHVAENSRVRANQQVNLLGDGVNLTLDCGGRLTVPEGKLVGGKINALGGVEAGWIGGTGGDATFIRVDPDACQLPCLDEVTATLSERTEALEKLNAGLAPIRAGGQAALNKLPAQQRSAVKQLMEKASALEFEIDVLKSKRKKAMEPMLAGLRPVVVVNRGISAGVSVTLKGVQWSSPERAEGRFKVALNAAGDGVACDPV